MSLGGFSAGICLKLSNVNHLWTVDRYLNKVDVFIHGETLHNLGHCGFRVFTNFGEYGEWNLIQLLERRLMY